MARGVPYRCGTARGVTYAFPCKPPHPVFDRSRRARRQRSGQGRGADGGTVRAEHARRLDRAAFELRVPKQSLVSELVGRYVNPDSPASLVALSKGWGLAADGRPRDAPAPRTGDDGGRRRVTVETLDQGDLTVGHHSFRPRNLEVLTPEEAAELLQVDTDVVLELAHTGELPGRELGDQWRFARAALLEWLGTGTADGTADVDAKG
jgi:excisionase family DNA binding protein